MGQGTGKRAPRLDGSALSGMCFFKFLMLSLGYVPKPLFSLVPSFAKVRFFANGQWLRGDGNPLQLLLSGPQ